MTALVRLPLEFPIAIPPQAALVPAYRTVFSWLHSSNAYSSIFFIVAGMRTSVIASQPSNATRPMEVTPSGSVMLCRLLQFRNACWPMLVTLVGSSTAFRFLQPRNAQSPTLVISSCRITVLI